MKLDKKINLKVSNESIHYDIAIDDMYSYTIDRLDSIMLPANVHFNKEGNVYLAEQVAGVIKKALENN